MTFLFIMVCVLSGLFLLRFILALAEEIRGARTRERDGRFLAWDKSD